VKIYFAGPLFSEADRDWIRAAIKEIESVAAEQGVMFELRQLRKRVLWP
jgi:nucleoside 2-deoxyribosyltransferase